METQTVIIICSSVALVSILITVAIYQPILSKKNKKVNSMEYDLNIANTENNVLNKELQYSDGRIKILNQVIRDLKAKIPTRNKKGQFVSSKS